MQAKAQQRIIQRIAQRKLSDVVVSRVVFNRRRLTFTAKRFHLHSPGSAAQPRHPGFMEIARPSNAVGVSPIGTGTTPLGLRKDEAE
jgi:hypothetical protein